VLLGEKISPQTIEYKNNQVAVSFLDQSGAILTKTFEFVEGSLVESQSR
jgi:hypothetical protein